MPAVLQTWALAAVVAVAGVVTGIAGPPIARAESTAQAGAGSHEILGFRSARFGMTDKEVKAAIRKDFGLSGDQVTEVADPVTKTRSLTIPAADLFPDSGAARISYNFGHASKRLREVVLAWGAPAEASPDNQRLVGTANILRNYFIGLDLPAERRAANVALGPGSVLVFRGFDQAGRMVAVVLSVPVAEKGKAAAPGTLLLSYLADPEKPDVFKLEEGAF